MLNRKGELVEASRANLFFVQGGVLYTPGISCGCLEGITRKFVLKIALPLGLICKTGRFDRRRLSCADEIFLTNSVRGVVPLTSLDGRPVAHGRPGPVTLKISKAYSALVRSALRRRPRAPLGNA